MLGQVMVMLFIMMVLLLGMATYQFVISLTFKKNKYKKEA